MYDKTKKTWSQRLKIHKNEKSNGTAASSSTTTTTTAASSSSTTTTAAASTASTAKAKTATTTTTTRTTTTITPMASKNFNKYDNQQQQQLQQQQQQSAYYHRHQNQKQAPTSTYFDHNNVNVVTATIQQQQQQQQQQHKPQTSFHRQAITPKTTKTQVNAVMHLPVGLQMGYDYNAAAAAASAPNGGSNITTATATARTNRDYNFGTYTRTYTEPWIYSTVRGIPGHHYASTYYHGCYQNPFIATSATTSAPSPYSPHHQQQYHPNRYHPHPSHHQQALSSAIFATPTNSNVTTSAATPTAMAVVICSCTEYLHGTKKYRDMKKPIICKKCKGTRLPLANIGGPGINMGLGMGVGMGVGLEGGLNVPFPNNANVKLLRPIGTAATVRCVSTTKKLRPTILDPQRDPYDLMRRTRLLSPEPPVPITNHNKLFNKEHTNTPISTSMRERSRSRIPKPKMLMMMMLNGHMNNETNNDNNNENYLKQQIDSNWLNDMEKGDDIKSLPAPSTSSTPSPSATVPLASGSTTAAETRPTSNLRRSILGCNVNPYDLISTTTTTTLDDDNDYDHNNIDDTNTNDDDNNNNNNNSKLSQSSLKTRDIEQEQLDKMKFMKPKLNHKSNLILTDRVHKLCNNKKLSSSSSASSSSTSSTSLTPSFNNNKPNKNGQMKGQSEKSNVKQIQSQKSSKNKTLKVKEKDQGDGDDQDDEQRTNARKFENTSEMFVKDTQTIEQAIASTENQKNLIGNNNIKYNVDKEKSSENNSDNSSEETSFVEMNNTEFITVTVTPTHNIKSILKRPVTAATSATLNDVNGDNSKTNSIPMTATTAMPDHYENLDNNNVNASRTYENNLQNNTMATRMSAIPTNTTKHLSSTASNNLAQQKQTRKKVQFMMDNKVITLSRNQLKQQQYEQYEGNYEAEDAEDKQNEETQKRKHDYRLANENDDEDDDNDANDSDDFDDSDDNDKTNCPSNYCDNDAVMTINYEYYNKKRNLHMQQLQREDSASSSSPEYYYSSNYELHNNGSNNNSSNNNYSDIVNDNSNEECVAYDKQFIQAMLLKKLQLDSKFVKEQHNNHSNEKAFNSTNLSKSNDNEISHSKDNSNDNDNYNDNDYDNDNYENFSSDNVLSSTFITTTYNSNEIADDNSHQIEELNNVMEDREEQLSKTIVNIEQKGNNNNYEVNDNNDKRNDNRTILQITSSNNHNSPPKEVKNCPGSNVKQAIHCFSMECLPSLDVSKDHFTKLKRSTSDRRGQLHHHNDNNNDKNVTIQKKEQQDHSHDLKKFIIALENPLAATEIKANGIKEEEQQQQKQHQQQKQKENNEESKEDEIIEKIKESINNLTSTAASIKITTKMITTEPKILTANINNSNESNYNQNRYEYENENQQKNIKQNVYTTKVQSSSSTSTSTTPSTSSSSFLSSSLASSSNKPQRTVVRVAPFNQKPTEVHRLKITHTDGHLPYNPNHTLRTITNNNNNTNNSSHFTTVNPTTKSPSYYSYVSSGPSAKDFEQKKTSILINGDDDCYSTTNLGCDDTCTPLYQSSVVVNDTDVNRKGVIDLRIINQNGNAVTINVSGCNYQGQQQTQKPFMPTSPMSNKSVIPIGENMNQVNLQRSASTTSSASSASSIISLSSLSGSGSGSGSGIGSGNGNDSGSGSGSNSLLPKSNRTLIRLEPKDKDTSRNRRDTMGVEESAPPPSPSLSPSSTKLWLTHEEELLKILRNPIEAVKLNLVPHVCGRQNNDTNDTNNNNNSKKNDEIDLEKVSFASTNTTNVTTATTITTATTAHPMKSKGEHESFISKLLEDPMLRQVADGLETETILELIENSLRRLQEAKDCNNMNDSSKDTPNNIGNVNRLINISLKLIQEEKATLNLYNHQRNNNKIISDNHNDQILSHISTAIPTHNINTCKDDENLSNRGSISSTNSFASAHNYEIFDYNDNNESDCYQSCSSEIASFMEDESNTNLETRSKFYKMLVDATLAEIESTTNLKEEEEEAVGKMRMKKSSIEMADGNDDDESDENNDNDDNDDDNDEDDNDNEKNLNIHSEHDYESICFSGDPIYEEISEIPPPLPKSAPPLNDVEADKKMARSIFEGASKYDILSYLVDAKERGIVKEESLFENSTLSVSGDPPNPQIIIEEESLDTLSDLDKRLQKTKYGRIENMKNIENSDTQMDNTATPNHSLIILRNNKQTAASNDIERNDSGVGSETSKSSRSKYQGKQQQQHQNQHLNVTTGKEFCSSPLLHLCEDCDGHVDTQLTNDGILFASLVCRKCGKKRMERKEIITEIVETEEKYGRDLQIILEEFYQPMLVAGLLTQEQLSAIFLNTEELLENSQTLAERMRDALDIALEQGDDDLLTVNIGKIFLISTQMLHAFESYCVRQAAASLLLANLEKEKELLRIFLKVSQMENTVLRRMNLNSFLMVPVQRVTKYPLLLSRLHKVTPQHLDGRDQLKEAQEKIELHLNHINQEAKDVPMKLWRRISSSSPNRRVSYEIDMINIKLRKMAIDLLEWNHDEVRFVMEGKLLFTQPTDNNWKKARTIKLVQVNALLVTNGKPNVNYKVENSTSDRINFPKHTGIREASLLIIKEKCGRYTFIHEPLFLDKCLICSEADWDEYFEIQEISSKDTFIFKAEDSDRTKQWYTTLQYHAQGMGSWRKRRNALANIMINGMLTRS